MLITTIAPGHWLDAPAAASYARMLVAGCPAGGLTDAGRTYAEQAEMYRLYLAGKLQATAAKPGTSKHETGRALDLAGATLAWVRAYGAAYGWIRDRVANEPWHLEYQAARDTKGKTPAPAAPPVTPTPAEPTSTVSLEVIDMDQAITRAFEHWTGFPPSQAQLELFTTVWMLNGEKVTAEQIRDSAAGQVAQAFRDELKRDPESQAVVAAYLAQFHGDIAKIREALAASPEGLAHH